MEEGSTLDADIRDISVQYCDKNMVNLMVAGACGGQPLHHSEPTNRTTRTRSQANDPQRFAPADQQISANISHTLALKGSTACLHSVTSWGQAPKQKPELAFHVQIIKDRKDQSLPRQLTSLCFYTHTYTHAGVREVRSSSGLWTSQRVKGSETEQRKNKNPVTGSSGTATSVCSSY